MTALVPRAARRAFWLFQCIVAFNKLILILGLKDKNQVKPSSVPSELQLQLPKGSCEAQGVQLVHCTHLCPEADLIRASVPTPTGAETQSQAYGSKFIYLEGGPLSARAEVVVEDPPRAPICPASAIVPACLPLVL